MKLERLTIENFRQYYGKQRIEFSRDSKRRVTVIHGDNGVGKTSLFLALNWCLYGKQVEHVKVIDNVGELLSKEAVSKAKPGEVVKATVELTFYHDDERYSIRRAIQGIKQKNGTIELNDADDFTMMRTGKDGQTKPVGNKIGTMNAILPVNVREYFLFDGEKIDNFAKPEAADQVKQAIYLVLKLEILDRARRHLEVNAQEYRKELKQISSAELRKLIEEEERLRAEREKAETQRTNLTKEIDSARRKVSDIEQRLREMQSSAALQQDRDRIDDDLKKQRAEFSDLVTQIRESISDSYQVFAEPAVTKSLKILDVKRKRGEIPSNIRQQFVQDLIEKMECICGRPFSKGGAEYKRLQKLIVASLSSSLEDKLIDISSSLRPFDDRVERIRRNLDSLMTRRTVLTDSIKLLEGELQDASQRLKGMPLEEIRAIEKKRQDYLADIDSYNIEIGSISERMRKIDEDLISLDQAKRKARKDAERERELTVKVDLAQQSADAIGEMYQVFSDDMRKRIEQKTKEIFRELVWKDSHFQDVQLGPDFNLEVIDRYGLSARPELSAGERQVLSLSFITAMSRISEEEAPLVMDTPFGRLSSQHRNSITRNLPKLADQLVLFVTDEELRDQSRENLEPHIGNEYRLTFDTRTSCTAIEEVRR